MARYRHPKHGYYVAGYGDDVAALKAAGWVLDEPSPTPAPPTASEPASVQPLPSTPASAAPVVQAAPQPAPQPQRRDWRPRRGR